MKETKFIEQNKEKWTEFEEMLRESRRDPDKLNNLFIQITDDLSYARTFYPNRSVRVFLNTLAQRIFHNIYKGKRFPAERFRLFWTQELPHVMWQTRKALLLSFSIFALAFAIGVVSSILNPEFARVILGDGYVEMTLENIQNGDPMAVYKDSGPLGMSAGIAANNLFVAFRTAIFGVLASIGTVLIMLYNGIMVGAFQYFFIEKGVFWDSFLTIWIHGTLEISAIIIAGAAGLVAGSGLLFPGTYRRVQAFQISMRQGLKIFLGIVPIIILAAVIEGFLTRYTETPHVIRGLFIGVSLLFVLWYFVWLPWFMARHGRFKQREEAKELPPDRHEPISFHVIKTSGEIFGDAFTILRRHPRMFWLSSLSGVLLFMTYLAFWSEKWWWQTFVYPDMPWGVLSGVADYFSNETAPFLYFFQWFLLAFVTVMAFRAVEKERFENADGLLEQEESALPAGKVWLTMLPVMAVMPLHILFLRAGTPVFGWLFSMIAFPLVGLWCATMYFETRNPLAALIRTFRLTRLGPAAALGFLSVNLGMMLFLFLDTPIWQMSLELFSWLIPPVEGAMAKFVSTVTTLIAGFIVYLFFYFVAVCSAFLYFSAREITDARSLLRGIEKVGVARKIRGLARE